MYYQNYGGKGKQCTQNKKHHGRIHRGCTSSRPLFEAIGFHRSLWIVCRQITTRILKLKQSVVLRGELVRSYSKDLEASHVNEWQTENYSNYLFFYITVMDCFHLYVFAFNARRPPLCMNSKRQRLVAWEILPRKHIGIIFRLNSWKVCSNI